MNLRIKHFIGNEGLEEISAINIGEIQSLFTLLLYKRFLKKKSK